MGSGKSAQAIEDITATEKNGKKYVCLKSSTDSRDSGIIKSRKGNWCPAIIFGMGDNLRPILEANKAIGIEHIFVDECQFMTRGQMNELISFGTRTKIDIYLYGLKMDYLDRPFPAIDALMNNPCDKEIKEIACTCTACMQRQAKHNVRVSAVGTVETDGETIMPGAANYLALCSECKGFAVKNGIKRLYTENRIRDRTLAQEKKEGASK